MEERIDRRSILWIERAANANGHQRPTRRRRERLHERAHAFGDRRQCGRTNLRDDYGELLAAVSRWKIDRTHRNPQRTRNALQRVIAREMPVTIVVKLEVVEIEDENSELLRIPSRCESRSPGLPPSM